MPDVTHSIEISAFGGGSPLLPPCGSTLDPLSFFGAPWRSVVTDLDGEIITLLDRLATNRLVETILDGAAKASGQVPSDSPEINILHTDGYPFLNQSNRLLWMFRREGTPTCWVPRFGGPIMTVQDQAASDTATTSYTAFDPWQLLYHKPAVDPVTGLLPDADGFTYKNMDPGDIVVDLLNQMWTFLSGVSDPHPEAHLDWGQTPYYEGTIEHVGNVQWLSFDQSMSVGEAFDKLVATNLCDIVLTPIWDPHNRPGIVAEVNVFSPMAGAHRNGAIMAWDMPSHSLVGVDALYDGDSLLNKARYAAAQGPSRPLASDAGSVARYGSYWEQQLFAGENSHHQIDVLAAREVGFRKNGKVTYEISPVAGRSPVPFVEYGLGDQLPVWGSNRLRRAVGPTLSSGIWEEMVRIYGISIALSNEDVERVEKLTITRED